MVDRASTSLPDVVQWEFTNRRRATTRIYEQAELTIEGEARLLGLARTIGDAMQAEKIEWDAIEAQLDGPGLDWALIGSVLSVIAAELPDVVVDSALTFVGIFPVNDDGSRNEDFDDERAFIKSSINIGRWVEMIRVFADQNDYARLARPFAERLGMNWDRLTGSTQSSTPEQQPPSDEPATRPSPRQSRSSSKQASATATPAGSSAT